MADALDLGSSPKGYRFNSCYPHQLNFKYILSTGVEPARFIGFPKNRQIFRVIRRDGLKSSKNKVFSLTFRQKKSKNICADMADRGSPKMRRHFWGGSGRRAGLKSSKNNKIQQKQSF